MVADTGRHIYRLDFAVLDRPRSPMVASPLPPVGRHFTPREARKLRRTKTPQGDRSGETGDAPGIELVRSERVGKSDDAAGRSARATFGMLTNSLRHDTARSIKLKPNREREQTMIRKSIFYLFGTAARMKMKRSAIWIGALAMLFGTTLPAQNIAGDWQGTLKAGPQEIRLVLAIDKSADGKWYGTFSSID
jgi:hypothetical protein